MGYLEEATHFATVGTFAPMAYEEWNGVPIQIDAICIKKSSKKQKALITVHFGLKLDRDRVSAGLKGIN